jgi:2-hydroxy-3-oxopropionate reductase
MSDANKRSTSIAFIGLGVMGAPMAANLLGAGYDVIGHNRTRQKVDDLIAHGGRGAESAAEAVAAADVIITMLPDSPDVDGVMHGSNGVFAHARRDVLWIDTSTIRPDVARRLARDAAEHGIRAVDAPVSGGEAGAIQASLSIMVGGSAEDFAAARGILDAVGSTIVHVGAAGAGQIVKAANQLLVAGTIELVAEALVFLDAHGVDAKAAVEVLAGGLAGNRILDTKADGMISGDYQPGFRVELHHKDLGIVIDAAREVGVAIPLGAVVAQLMGAIRVQGHGGLDHTALRLLVEQLSGRARKNDHPTTSGLV